MYIEETGQLDLSDQARQYGCPCRANLGLLLQPSAEALGCDSNDGLP